MFSIFYSATHPVDGEPSLSLSGSIKRFAENEKILSNNMFANRHVQFEVSFVLRQFDGEDTKHFSLALKSCRGVTTLIAIIMMIASNVQYESFLNTAS